MHFDQFLSFVFAVLILGTFGLVLARVLAESASTPRPLADAIYRLRSMRIGYLSAAIGVVGMLLLVSSSPRFAVLIVGFGLIGAYVAMLINALSFLMTRTDDDFPGTFDKPIWAALLLATGPLGLFLFRAYRQAHWPEPVEETRAKPAPLHDLL